MAQVRSDAQGQADMQEIQPLPRQSPPLEADATILVWRRNCAAEVAHKSETEKTAMPCFCRGR